MLETVMSVDDIPGKVILSRHWPLGTVLAMQAAILMFVFDTRASIADLDRRANELKVRVEKQDAGERQISNDIASIKATVEAILRQMAREDSRAYR